MATRGIRILFTLPVIIALFAGAVWAAVQGGFGAVVAPQPDQVVVLFLNQITTGQAGEATQYLGPATSHIDLVTLGLRLEQRHGPIVLNEAAMQALTPEYAVVWSRTETAQGNVYFITWTLVRRDDRWIIRDIEGLKDIVPDMPGLT